MYGVSVADLILAAAKDIEEPSVSADSPEPPVVSISYIWEIPDACQSLPEEDAQLVVDFTNTAFEEPEEVEPRKQSSTVAQTIGRLYRRDPLSEP